MTLEYSSTDSANSRLTQVASSATADTKNTTYTELIASTSQAAEWIRISLSGDNGSSISSFLIDLATGAASSETPFLQNIAFFTKSDLQGADFIIPVPTISSGTRISATCQSSAGGSVTVGVGVELSDVSSYGTCAAIETIGADTTNSYGTTIDPGGVANTLGSWVELSASTSHDYDYIVLMIDNQNNTAMTQASFLAQIGVGGSGSEVVRGGPFHFIANAFENLSHVCFVTAPGTPIPSGSRVSVRAQCTITDATDRLFGASIIGVDMNVPTGSSGPGPKIFSPNGYQIGAY